MKKHSARKLRSGLDTGVADELRDELRELRAEVRALRRERGGGEGHGRGGSSAGDDAGEAGVSRSSAFGVGAAGATALLLLAGNRERLRPLLVTTLKEAHRFGDWLRQSAASLKDDLTDASSEGRHAYELDLEAHAAALEKEQELVGRLRDVSKRRKEQP